MSLYARAWLHDYLDRGVVNMNSGCEIREGYDLMNMLASGKINLGFAAMQMANLAAAGVKVLCSLRPGFG